MSRAAAKTRPPSKAASRPRTPSRPKQVHEVLTLKEAAAFLRVTERVVLTEATLLKLPGRLIGGEWRFSRAVLLEWLRGQVGFESIQSQLGAFDDDQEDQEQLRASIYQARS